MNDEPVDLDLGLEQALRERLGGDVPPDLVDAVRARLAARPLATPWRRWLPFAAAMVVGTTVVVAIALSRRAADAVPAQEPAATAPLPVQVGTASAVAALPATTRAVEVFGGDDATIEALVRLRDLEVLVVREPWNEAFGSSPKMQPPPNPPHVTNAAWVHLAKLTKLRRLEFSGTPLVARIDGPHSADVVTALEPLPLLETLSLRFLDAPDVAIARLPGLRGLRHLDLSFDHGFRDGGIDALLQCRSLRRLSLRGCQQLTANMLSKLGGIPTLEELDLSAIDGVNWRAGQSEPAGEGKVQFNFHIAGEGEVRSDEPGRVANLLRQGMERRRAGVRDGVIPGVGDETIEALARLPRLRVLEIGGGGWTLAGLAPLGQCASLEELVLTGSDGTKRSDFVASLPRGLRRLELCGDHPNGICSALREHLPNLRHLSIAACDLVTDAGIRELLAMPSLRVLDMRQLRDVSDASIDALIAAKQLEGVDLRHCRAITAADVERLRRERPALRVEANAEPR